MPAILSALCLAPLLLARQAPSKELEPLSFLLGDWKSDFTRKSPAGKEEMVVSTVHTRWRLEGKFLEMEESQKVDDKPASTTMLLVTYDGEKRAFQGFIFTSSFPTYPMSVLGNFKDGKLVFNIDAETSPVKATFVYEKLSDAKYRGSSSVLVGEEDMKEIAEYTKEKA
jgi:hypothetical protein